LQLKEGVAAVGAYSSALSWEWEREDDLPSGYDQARVGDIDIDLMKQVAVEGRRKTVEGRLKDLDMDYKTYDAAIREAQEAHEEWLKLPVNDRPRGAEYRSWVKSKGFKLGAEICSFQDPRVEDGMSIWEWVESAVPISAYAVIKDGKWLQKGDMGWWGVSRNEDSTWEEKFEELFYSLKDDQWITFVDCHI
jgi:hypothetical protein